jgi:hypothetical protein
VVSQGRVVVVRAMADPSLKTAKGYKRVVVTGLGVVSSLGHDADEFYSNLLEGTPPAHAPRLQSVRVRGSVCRLGKVVYGWLCGDSASD